MALLNHGGLRAAALASSVLLALVTSACDSSPPAGGAPSGSGAQRPAPTAAAPGTEGARGAGPAPPASTPASSLDAGTAVADAGNPTEVAAQHVLVAWAGAKNAPKTVRRSKVEARKRAEEALGVARSGKDFAEVVKQFSDDEATVSRLGSVGKFKRDAMVEPFAAAAFALPVGSISDVVETPFGFHIIKRNQ
jgi:hypothetical protein